MYYRCVCYVMCTIVMGIQRQVCENDLKWCVRWMKGLLMK